VIGKQFYHLNSTPTITPITKNLDSWLFFYTYSDLVCTLFSTRWFSTFDLSSIYRDLLWVKIAAGKLYTIVERKHVKGGDESIATVVHLAHRLHNNINSLVSRGHQLAIKTIAPTHQIHSMRCNAKKSTKQIIHGL